MWRAENGSDVGPSFDSQNALGGMGGPRGGDIEGFEPTDVGDEAGDDADIGDEGPVTSDSPVPDDPGGTDEI